LQSFYRIKIWHYSALRLEKSLKVPLGGTFKDFSGFLKPQTLSSVVQAQRALQG